MALSKDEKFLLRPASNMKVLTSAAGLEFLGTEYTF
ncbi:MAG: D-alanyl-D-alanine carboxypeptidase [Ignavibacteriales bacterium]|nr:D-alanyl-D-alanine carboxypeptidase [Ignavibacteriales bacterium]